MISVACRLEESTSRNASVRVRGVQGEVRETVYGGRDGWLQISVLVDGDLAGLMRLCVTLAKGRFNEPVALVFHLNAKQPQVRYSFFVSRLSAFIVQRLTLRARLDAPRPRRLSTILSSGLSGPMARNTCRQGTRV